MADRSSPKAKITDGLSPQIAEHVLAMELFQGVPPGVKKLLVRFGRIVEQPAGIDFIQQGEFTSNFHVLIQGIATGYRRETDGSVSRLVELSAGDWFGELSALSNQPSPARFYSDSHCVLLTLEPGLFKDLYKASRPFRALVDKKYSERSLAVHLAVVPAFRGLSRQDAATLKDVARFETVQAGKEIAARGEAVDAVHLVRSGAVTFSRSAGKEGAADAPIDGYLMDNSCFGEAGLWDEGARWDGSYCARTDVELLSFPVAEIKARFRGAPEILQRLAEAAETSTREERGAASGAAHADELHGMVHRGSVKGGEALVINLEKCVRCNACVESCVAVHADGVPRLSKSGFRVAAEANQTQKPISLVTSCYHCKTPGCMMACSYGAIRRDPQGLIRIVSENCVGCAMCVSGCPYDVIRLTDPNLHEKAADSFLSSIPIVGKWLAKDASTKDADGPLLPTGQGFHKEVEVKGKAVKCDRCEGLPFEACVYNCPCGAIERREPDSLFGSSPHPS